MYKEGRRIYKVTTVRWVATLCDLKSLLVVPVLCISTECPKIYRKSVQYTENLYLSRCSTDLPYILGHSALVCPFSKLI